MRSLILALTLLPLGAAQAQTSTAQTSATPTPATTTGTLNVATGSPTGTYSAMFKNIGRVCTQSAYLRERGSSGSLENIDLLLNNEVSLAFVQSDVLKARQQIDKDPRVDGIKALLPLHREELHLFALPSVVSRNILGQTKTQGVAKFEDLKGKKVAAWGGSLITARVVGAMTGLNFEVVSVKDQESAFAALRSRQVDAVLAVVGQPATWVKTLSGVNLVAVPLSDRMKSIYSPAKLFYPNISAASVPTVAVQSVLATRDFKTPERKKLLLAYQKCAVSKLVNLQEDEGMHPKWQDVDFKTWPWPQYK
ncbi:TAXI family TRAP transporter solute-binding subunit [Deinococcus gobiensis]|uniref:TRAP transporter solute receptor like protein n=1 Tax=Deinococcus gobiensis (strain DSM 21396 / JCM 16679 / CGMCC 1.7299 / I-0) TaxID=745776 RepID=H8GS44_DEIGI|nr:TAXI family TRAP transporter solute-binding subunit [Deinococcus gobiensis]AFD23939.1 TRAP transporter solute receptor like protein [Deinococcus gobiensis I-0]